MHAPFSPLKTGKWNDKPSLVIFNASGLHKHFVRETRFLIASHTLDILNAAVWLNFHIKAYGVVPALKPTALRAKKIIGCMCQCIRGHSIESSGRSSGNSDSVGEAVRSWSIAVCGTKPNLEGCPLVRSLLLQIEIQKALKTLAKHLSLVSWQPSFLLVKSLGHVFHSVIIMVIPFQEDSWCLSMIALSLCRAALPHSVASGRDKTNRAAAGQRKVQLKGHWLSKNKYIYI